MPDYHGKLGSAPRRAANFAVSYAIALILGIAGPALLPRPAAAQSIVAFVNGEPVTSLDVEQRMRIMKATASRRPTKHQALQDLVDEKVKLREAERRNIAISDAMVDRALANMARQGGRSVANLTAALAQAGINPSAFKSKLKADLAWREILQEIAPGTFQVRDADVVAALIARGQQPTARATQYTLRQFVFVVPRGSPASVGTQRMREAESLRSKFGDCERDVALAREFSEVVVKDPVIRISSDLPQRLQQLLEKTPDGRMTPPEPTAAGIEVVAVCGRKETVADLSSHTEIRRQLLAQRVEAQEKQILERLRRQTIIEYR